MNINNTGERYAKSTLLKHLADARQRLIQTGTRNRLVHTSRFSKQGKAIDVVDERSADAFRILVTDGRRMRFGHDPSIREVATPDEPLLPAPRQTEIDPARYTDLILQTRFGQDRLQKKLLGLAREARTLEEEQGINALYLAMGFLRWYEDEKSETLREAPLVLVPVNLRRNDRSSTYELEARGEDISTNEPLKHRLNDDFGVKVPEVPETEDWSPTGYFAAVAEAISGQSRWSIDPDGIQLGFFSFAKLLMVKDLEPEKWPDDRLVKHQILAGLLVDGFGSETDDFPDTNHLDALFNPADLIQVVDADASQTLVIETVRKGRNLVVQGPPGTGKSQTITNIIAAAAHDGKSVLFVAEKMAALNVVHSRLRASGLQDICLELHSRSANKKIVLEELGRTLNAGSWSAHQSDAEELRRLRDRLNSVADVMHRQIGETGVTAYRALSTLIRLSDTGFSPTDINIPDVERWTKLQLEDCLKAANFLTDVTAKAGAKLSHPFYGVRRADVLPTDRQRLRPKLEALLAALTEANKIATVVAQSLGISASLTAGHASNISGVVQHISTLSSEAVPFAARIAEHGGIDRARALAQIGKQYQAIRDQAGSNFTSVAVAARIDHIRPMLAIGHGFIGRLSRQYRAGSIELASFLNEPLPQSQPARMALLDRLVELQLALSQLNAQDGVGSELLGPLWMGQSTDFLVLSEAVEWLSNLLQKAVGLNAPSAVRLRKYEPQQLRSLGSRVSTGAVDAKSLGQEILGALDVDMHTLFGVENIEGVPFGVLETRARAWLDNLDRLDEWSQLRTVDEALRSLAGDEVSDAVAAGILAPEQIRSTIRYIHAEALYRRFVSSESWVTNLTAIEKAELIGSFREREKARRIAVAKVIRGEHLARLPRGGMGAMGIVRGEIGKRRGHKPIRRLMTEAGSVIQQIKPILLMSPISVAQYLPPGVMEFDLLVIDEASQVRPEDALGAIARAKQIVVVGDKRQLPPTSFFDRVISDVVEEEPEEENEIPSVAVTAATELESILTLCEARGLTSRMLRWHYRSRHPSLIEVSNEVFYSENGGLILFPSPSATRDVDGLSIQRVLGAYDRGGKRNNPIEADAVAKAVADHATHFPARSLGVVTFSTAQRDKISERLDILRIDHEALDIFLRERESEEFFVKNIENVQGDERDVILVSVGYGPRVAGSRLDSMAFGPVSTEGGERRLNVLFTRARYRTQVFVSFVSADINLERSKSVGARVLKQFLQYAESGSNHQPIALDADPDSDFEVAVAAEIRRLGYTVDFQIGSAGFKIDLAVRKPGDESRYMLAIECDGATYHSAVWARERDRLRQEVLEGLGWRFHRVWSTDWFHRRVDETRRLEEALIAAISHGIDSAIEIPEDVPTGFASENIDEFITLDSEHIAGLPDYEVANFSVPTGREPHEVPIFSLAPIVEKIINIEGPVHEEEIARRVASLFGKQKAGSRIVAAVDSALDYLKRRDREIIENDGFWLTLTQKADVPIRNRSRALPNLRKANLLPPIEIAVAIKKVLGQNGILSWDELPRAVALLFGFQRTGPEFRPAIVPVIEAMLQTGEIAEGQGGLQTLEPR